MRIDASELEVSAEPADSEPGRALLAEMTEELDSLYEKVEGSLDSVPATPEQMAPPQGSFLVLRMDGKPVACGGVKRLGEGVGEIKRMYVVPALRGRGIARALLGALETETERLGYSSVRLDTGPAQPDARSLYESAGYTAIADYNDNPYATHWFEKALAPRARRSSG